MRTPARSKRTSRMSVAISLALHALIIGLLMFLAAREGMLGKELKKIAVTMVPKEKPPEKPKEPEPQRPAETPPPVQPEPAPTERAPAMSPPSADANSATVPPPALTAPVAAPPPAALPALSFDGGRLVQTSSDPHVLYKGHVEYALRSRWTRPEGVADEHYVAEIDVAIGPTGHLEGFDWIKGSGDSHWDNSVRQVLTATRSIGRPPPRGFPTKVRVRFDVQVATELAQEERP